MQTSKKALLIIFICCGIIFISYKFYQEKAQSRPKDDQKLVVVTSMVEELDFKIGEAREIEGITVMLNKVIGDSRCPKDAQCIQKGKVTVHATLTKGSVTEERDIEEDASPFTFEGYTFSMRRITPVKEKGVEIASKDYVMKLRVSPITRPK